MLRRMAACILLSSVLLTGCDCGACVIGPALVSGAASGIAAAAASKVICNSK